MQKVLFQHSQHFPKVFQNRLSVSSMKRVERVAEIVGKRSQRLENIRTDVQETQKSTYQT